MEEIINKLLKLQKLNMEFTEEDLKKSNDYENFINIYNNYVSSSYINLQLNAKDLDEGVKSKIKPYIFTQEDYIDKLFNIDNLAQITPIIDSHKDILIIPSLINDQITEEICEYNKILFKILIDYYEIRLNDIVGILKNCLIVLDRIEFPTYANIIFNIFKINNVELSNEFMKNFILFYNIVNIIFNNIDKQIEDNEETKLLLLKTYNEYKEFIEEKIITDKFINFGIIKNNKNIILINKLIYNQNAQYYKNIIYDNINIENKIINNLNKIIFSNKNLHLIPFVSVIQNLLVNNISEITYDNLLNICKTDNLYSIKLNDLIQLSHTSLNPMYINTYEILKFKYELLKHYYYYKDEIYLINNLKHIYLNYLNEILIEKLIKSNIFYVLYYCDLQYSNYGYEKYKKFSDFIKLNADLICTYNIKNNSTICHYINKILNNENKTCDEIINNFNNIELEKILNNKDLENNIKLLLNNYVNLDIDPLYNHNYAEYIDIKFETEQYIYFLHNCEFLTNIIKSLITIDDKNINIKIMKYYYLLNFSLIFFNNNITLNKLIYNNNEQLNILKKIFPIFSNLFNITNDENKNILKHVFYFYKLIFLNYSNMRIEIDYINYPNRYFIFNNHKNIKKIKINIDKNTSYIIYKFNNYIIENNVYYAIDNNNNKMKFITSDNEDEIKLFEKFKIDIPDNITDEMHENIIIDLNDKFKTIYRYNILNNIKYFENLITNNIDYINMQFCVKKIEKNGEIEEDGENEGHILFIIIDIKNLIVYNFDSHGPAQRSFSLVENYKNNDMHFVILNSLGYLNSKNNIKQKIKIINLDTSQQRATGNCTYHAYYFYNYVMSEIHNNKNPQDFINYFNKNRVTGKQLSDFIYNITTPYINMYFANI
jgi:hypothetical protein